ncbi:hypothetical protein [Catenulispora pinisilvae]|uniref:hypothetical protein n=1 Tax=Catenulispora pinisilvae TaxID=2705253 RepID=UPI0018912A3D|nr:hypothetical protein [Catenulispora pinisilvae]
MTGPRRPGISRRLVSLLAGLALAGTALSGASPAQARGSGGTGSSQGCQSANGDATCISGVYFTGPGGTAVTTTGGTSTDGQIPGCWYEPSKISPEFLKIAFLIPLVNLVIVGLTGGDTGTDGDFHAGQKGAWWEFVFNPAMSLPDAQAHCDIVGPILEWVPAAAPPPQEHVETWKMAGAARNEINLTAPTLTLRPGANNQIVNLPTLVSFTNPFPRTWVTARLNVDGYALAATTIATPVSITVNAGTPNASPSSCTYTLAPAGGNYQVDPNSTHCSDGSTGPNAGIVYRRPTNGTTYPLTATVTWNVTWTDTDNPDSPPQTGYTFAPLTLDTPATPVTVNEVETVNH